MKRGMRRSAFWPRVGVRAGHEADSALNTFGQSGGFNPTCVNARQPNLTSGKLDSGHWFVSFLDS
jgi:hypothetical protein